MHACIHLNIAPLFNCALHNHEPEIGRQHTKVPQAAAIGPLLIYIIDALLLNYGETRVVSCHILGSHVTYFGSTSCILPGSVISKGSCLLIKRKMEFLSF